MQRFAIECGNDQSDFGSIWSSHTRVGSAAPVRAGYGWSDPAPFPHPASTIAEDLHTLLGNEGIAPPYVLVGFSFGGICARVYTNRYRPEVVGMVLVDSTHVDEREPIAVHQHFGKRARPASG